MMAFKAHMGYSDLPKKRRIEKAFFVMYERRDVNASHKLNNT